MNLLIPFGFTFALLIGLTLSNTVLDQAAAPDPNYVCFLGVQGLNDLVPLLYFGMMALLGIGAIGTGVLAVRDGSMTARAGMLSLLLSLAITGGLVGGLDANRAYAQSAGSCLLRNGTLAMTGNLDMGDNDILNLGNLSGHTLRGNVDASANNIKVDPIIKTARGLN